MKLYVVSEATVGNVPEITPVELFKDIPLGKDCPEANAKVIESETSAAAKDMLIAVS